MDKQGRRHVAAVKVLVCVIPDFRQVNPVSFVCALAGNLGAAVDGIVEPCAVVYERLPLLPGWCAPGRAEVGGCRIVFGLKDGLVVDKLVVPAGMVGLQPAVAVAKRTFGAGKVFYIAGRCSVHLIIVRDGNVTIIATTAGIAPAIRRVGIIGYLAQNVVELMLLVGPRVRLGAGPLEVAAVALGAHGPGGSYVEGGEVQHLSAVFAHRHRAQSGVAVSGVHPAACGRETYCRLAGEGLTRYR